MKFKLKIDCNNAAFEEDAGAELGYILDRLGNTLNGMIRADAKGIYSGGVMDSNGNTVGKWECAADKSDVPSYFEED
jgi:hypothetical protein